MDSERNVLEWTVDAVAALSFGVAVAWSGALVLAPPAAIGVGAGALLLVLAALRMLPPGAERHALPPFIAQPWAGVLEASLPQPAAGKVVRLAPPQPPVPTAGEMRDRIDQHLRQRQSGDTARVGDVVLLGADASAALRHAIGELKRALN